MTTAKETIPQPDGRRKPPGKTAGGHSFGLALGGGGARGLAHIPMLEACDELGVKPGIVAGTSIGALVGAAYCSGLSGADLHDYCAQLFANRGRVLKHLIQRWNGSLWDYWNPLKPSFLNGEKLIETVLPREVAKTFETLRIPLIAVAADFHSQSAYIMKSGPLIPAVTASSALPAIFTPVEIDGRILIDGGFVNPLPFDLLAGQAKIIAAIDVSGGADEQPVSMPSSMETIIGSTQIMLRSIVNEKLKSHAPDILIRPYVANFRVLDFLKAEEIWAATAPAKEEFKRALEARFSRAAL